jgi:hypothetical protein
MAGKAPAAKAKKNGRQVASELATRGFVPSSAIEQTASFPYSPAELEILAAELKELRPGEDAIFLAYAKIAEALPLSRLALLTMGEGGAALVAALGFDIQAFVAPALDSFPFSKLLPGQPLPASLVTRLMPIIGRVEGAQLRASLVRGPGRDLAALWLYADSRLDKDDILAAAMARVLVAAPPPRSHVALPEEEAAETMAQRLPLGTGRATLLRFDLADFLATRGSLLPGLVPSALFSPILRSFQAILGGEGRVMALEGLTLIAMLLSHDAVDAELMLVQFRKSLKKSLPLVAGEDFPQGRALGIDLASASSLELFERFAAD